MKKTNYSLYHNKLIKTTKELLKYSIERYKNKTAFIYPINRKEDASKTFYEFASDVNALGTYFHSLGLNNCHIAIYGENSYEWILTHFAVTCGKNVIVPIDKELDASSICELLIDSECKAIVYSDTYSDVVGELEQMQFSDMSFIKMSELPKCIAEGLKLIDNGYTDYINIEINQNDLASIVYTSGTTGKSKGVMMSHYNFCLDMCSATGNVLLEGTSLLVLPLHHSYALVANVYSEMFYGCTVYINKSLKNLSKDFQKCKPNHLFAVPLIIETLYKNIWNNAQNQGKDKLLRILIIISNMLLKIKIDFRKILFKSVLDAFGGNLKLLVSGGAYLDEKYIRRFNSFGITLLNGYGITECGPFVSVNRNELNVIGSVGLPLKCNKIKISEDGEVLVKGDNVMLGYYHNEDENKKVFSDGWFKTGDIGKIDDFGALHITGRIKNLIILANGENIAAEAIEKAVCSISYVKEVVAFEKDGVIAVEVYLDETFQNAEQKLHDDIEKLNRTLPLTHNIGKIIIRDKEFPKTTTKKIKRNYN